MKYSLRLLLFLVSVAAACSAFVMWQQRPVLLHVGMPQSDFESELTRIGVDEVLLQIGPSGDYKPEKDAPPIGGGMWVVPSANVTIEAYCENYVLKKLNVWDWNGRKLDRYHHMIEYDEVKSIRLPLHHADFSSDKIRTINAGVNPPSPKNG